MPAAEQMPAIAEPLTAPFASPIMAPRTPPGTAPMPPTAPHAKVPVAAPNIPPFLIDTKALSAGELFQMNRSKAASGGFHTTWSIDCQTALQSAMPHGPLRLGPLFAAAPPPSSVIPPDEAQVTLSGPPVWLLPHCIPVH